MTVTRIFRTDLLAALAMMKAPTCALIEGRDTIPILNCVLLDFAPHGRIALGVESLLVVRAGYGQSNGTQGDPVGDRRRPYQGSVVELPGSGPVHVDDADDRGTEVQRERKESSHIEFARSEVEHRPLGSGLFIETRHEHRATCCQALPPGTFAKIELELIELCGERIRGSDCGLPLAVIEDGDGCARDGQRGEEWRPQARRAPGSHADRRILLCGRLIHRGALSLSA